MVKRKVNKNLVLWWNSSFFTIQAVEIMFWDGSVLNSLKILTIENRREGASNGKKSIWEEYSLSIYKGSGQARWKRGKP